MSGDGLGALVDAARALAECGGRRILGITGAPGAGKSSLAEALVDALGGRAVGVGMDGFHLAQRELTRLGRAGRKGAPDTFDAAGYVALLRRLRAAGPETIYAPEFRRDLEEPIACAIPVRPDVPLVVTEGNYLLLPEPPWDEVPALLDECWFLALAEPERVRRLIARHRAFGRSEPDALARATTGADAANATRIAATRSRATRVVELG